ncbi:type I restriction-modification system specificity determinant [Agrobacterium tumefaciens CCNWGS0286]|uniref:restriction endonuclease subunit S n=1 Tax=Agrobacterium tumefaciens TaxID=358 RepID=UPI000233331F|nr:restriction endonuclease subunit S [Agrobacterium tumefaciens]EHH03926.1 type I restriction-modification system specificity determinant [Agrobacterium tumefaciens CCNWGS0286]
MNAMTMRLSDLCDFVGVQVDPSSRDDDIYLGLEHVTPGRFVTNGEGKASDVQSSKYVFQRGDVLYGKLRPYLDKAILAAGAGICTTELLVLRPKEFVDPRFLVGVVHAPSFVEHAIAGTTGVQHPRTSWNHIREFELPAFEPGEQTKIANLLWQVHDSLIANEAAIEAGSDLKRAAMRALFTKGLRCEGQKDTAIGPVPESWDVVALGSLGRIGSGTTPDRKNADFWRDGSIPWVTSGRMYEREINGSDVCVTALAIENSSLPMLTPGAVLIAIVGQGKTLGHCALLSVEATVSRHVGFVQPDQAVILPAYLRGYLEGQYDHLRQLASGNGSTRAALTGGILKSVRVPLPPTLDEQQEIVAILDAIDRKIDLHRRKRAVLDELFKSLLNKVMTGEIRVADLDLSALEPVKAKEATA